MKKTVLSMNTWPTIRELSALIADAILCGPGKQIIIRVVKKIDENSQQRREYISDDEWLELVSVWANAGLPELIAGTPKSIWPKYEAAFRDWKTSQKWELEPIFDDQEYIQNDIYVSHAATVRAKEKDLIRAIQNGEMVAFDGNRSPIVDGSYEKLLQAKISPNEFARYAASIGLCLEVSETNTIMTTAVDTAGRSTRYKQRINNLDAPIIKAIAKAQTLATSTVFVSLKELALSEEKPFTGVIDDSGALCYTTDNDKHARLTKDALRNRLKRHVLPQDNGG